VTLRQGFEFCGILTELYVSRNRNARGQLFGFVRFTNVRDVVKLNKALNNVVFGNLKVWENVARFDRFGDIDFNNRERKRLRNSRVNTFKGGEGEKRKHVEEKKSAS